MTKEKQFSFLSKDGKTKIHAVKWMPESGEPLKNPSKYFSDFSKTVPLHTLFFSY